MISVEVSNVVVSTREARTYVDSSKRVRRFLHHFMRDVREVAKQTFLSAELGFSTRPFRYIRSFRITEDFSIFRGPEVILYNWAPTAVMVEFGAHARGVTPILGYAPMRTGVDAAIAKWAGRVVRV